MICHFIALSLYRFQKGAPRHPSLSVPYRHTIHLITANLSDAMPRTTIKDIAAALCLSVATVSRALADDPSISADTRHRVQDKARQMGYRRNRLAEALRSGSSHSIGVLISQFSSTCSAVIEGVQQVASQHNVALLIASSNLDAKREKANIRMMQHNMADGLILIFTHHNANYEEFRHMALSRYPVVFVGSFPDGLAVSRAIIDDEIRPYFLMDHLINAGYRRIVLVDNVPEVGRTGTLLPTYREALDKFGIPFDPALLMNARPGVDGGREIVDQLLERGIDFDCIYTYSEYVAAAVLNRLRQRGLRVPQDVGVATYYGTPMGRVTNPQITSMEIPLVELGRAAAELLFRQIADPGTEPEDVRVMTQLKVRGSTVADAAIEDIGEEFVPL